MGSLDNFINRYYLGPIWSHEGYNIVNTLTYALIAIAAVYLIFYVLKKYVTIDKKFVYGVLSFVPFGATLRVVTDSIDTGVFKPVTPFHGWILDSHIYDYGYITVSPGIYILTAALLFVSIAILHRIKRMDLLWVVGTVLWLPNFLLLIPFMKYAAYAIPIIVLAGIPAYLAFRYFKDEILAAVVAGHALDGAATFFVIDVFSKMTGIQYGEQHVFASGIGAIWGSYIPFYIIKIGVSFAAAYFVMKEKMPEDEKRYIALVLIIMGFAPGIRDVLRMMTGS